MEKINEKQKEGIQWKIGELNGMVCGELGSVGST